MYTKQRPDHLRCAIVEFDEPDAVRMVLGSQPHLLRDQPLRVKVALRKREYEKK
ncbi:unnamed protein product [Dibothriocephalus latus]|uniref:RRM domain-containing protein n=1 Tax=Dibothriocephalus latus TaxID=60516 RepID=A0A3P6QKW1_DIBLA|nr:unnamed protein product [Dibothriocephalus latus]